MNENTAFCRKTQGGIFEFMKKFCNILKKSRLLLYEMHFSGGEVMEEFMKWYEAVYPEMYRVAYYYMRNQQEAEDAVQDAVLTAFEKRHQLKDKEKYRSWMMTILANRCKKRMRKWFRREEDIAGLFATEEKRLAKEVDYAIDTAVKQAFWKLEEQDRLIVGLSLFGGYKGEEIAEITGKNHSTVRSRYHRALQKMKKELEV